MKNIYKNKNLSDELGELKLMEIFGYKKLYINENNVK